MPGRRGLRSRPLDYIDPSDHERWEEVVLDDAPTSVLAVQSLVVRLVDAIDDRSIRSVARDAGLQHTTLNALLGGERWPDMVTIVKLEQALDVNLWPGRELGRDP